MFQLAMLDYHSFYVFKDNHIESYNFCILFKINLGTTAPHSPTGPVHPCLEATFPRSFSVVEAQPIFVSVELRVCGWFTLKMEITEMPILERIRW